MVEMVVESVRVNLQTHHRVVVLKDKEVDRYLPIWIGNSEADAIVMQLQQVAVPRPQTHDLLKSVISGMGGVVNRIIVNDLNDDIFYARIFIDVDGRQVEIDSRPSDAIALAVRVQAPIFVEEVVLEKAGVTLESEESDASKDASGNPPDEEELRKLSAFRDFINTLDLDDLGRSDLESQR
ncbi:MAG: bifunctional nuclease family protein [Bacteroidetes bacterium]|nr:bifunctional nuclease family protein [Bacteroidota bacterium]